MSGGNGRVAVEGDGVVGQQPGLDPGESFMYASFCPLPTAWGTMEGEFTMTAEDGEQFEVQVGRFFLALPADEPTSP